MAVTVTAVGTVDANTGGSILAPGLPAGTTNGDILVVFVETGISEAITIANWTQAPNSPIDSQNTTNQTRLHVWYKRANGSDTCSVDLAAANHGIARIIGFTGAKATGSPWDVTGSNTGALGTTYSTTGVTTTAGNELVIVGVSSGVDTSSSGSFTMTNANLSGITTYIDNASAAGNGGQIAAGVGLKVAAGATGITTGNLPTGTGSDWATWIGALLDNASSTGNFLMYM